MKINFILFFIFIVINNIYSQTITTFAGTGTAGFSGNGGQATSATLNYTAPQICSDNYGNLYITDQNNNVIRKVNSAGIITTVVGTGYGAGLGYGGFAGDGGPALDAELAGPTGVAVDGSGNIYVYDAANERIRKVNTSGIISTITGTGYSTYSGDGGLATDAGIDGGQEHLAVDNSGNVYFTSFAAIRKISTTGIITRFAGNGTPGYSGDGGPATDAELEGASGLAVDQSGNLYFADLDNRRIRTVDVSGTIHTSAGNGTGGFSGDGGTAPNAEFDGPTDIALDDSGNFYIADVSRVRIINSSGIIHTYAGNGINGYSGDGGPATMAKLEFPFSGIAVDNSCNVYTANGYGGTSTTEKQIAIRKISYNAITNKVQQIVNENSYLEVFPNPAFSELTISSSDEIKEISILNEIGQIVFCNEFNARKVQIYIANLPSGVYFIKANYGKYINKITKM